MGVSPDFLAIAGGSASGKSAVARAVRDRLGKGGAAILAMDDYYLHPRDMHEHLAGYQNWDSPNALNWNALTLDLARLRQGETVTPPFDSSLYIVEAGNPVSRGRPIVPAPLIIVEGLFALFDPTLTSQMQFCVFIDASEELRRSRRQRAVNEEDYYFAVLKPMHDTFVEPTRQRANWVLSTDGNAPEGVADQLLELIRRTRPGHPIA